MVRITSIGIAVGALAIAALPVRADDQARGLILNQFGGYGLRIFGQSARDATRAQRHAPHRAVSPGERRHLRSLHRRRCLPADLQLCRRPEKQHLGLPLDNLKYPRRWRGRRNAHVRASVRGSVFATDASTKAKGSKKCRTQSLKQRKISPGSS